MFSMIQYGSSICHYFNTPFQRPFDMSLFVLYIRSTPNSHHARYIIALLFPSTLPSLFYLQIVSLNS